MNFLRHFLTFSKKEKKALLLISCIIMLLIVIKGAVYWMHDDKYEISNREQKEILAFQSEIVNIKKNDTLNFLNKNYKSNTVYKPVKLFSFNPSNVSKDEMLLLGLSEKQIGIIENFRNKGGKFYNKESFKNIYTITEEQYYTLEPYIQISKTTYQNNYSQNKYPQNTNYQKPKTQVYFEKINLNNADTTELKKIYGVGIALAQRIIDYRSQIFCFQSLSQLTDIYGIDSLKALKIVPFLYIENCIPKKINLKEAEYFRLKRHPLMRGIATKIIYLRGNKPFHSMQILVEENLIPQNKLQLYQHYFSIE